MCQFQILVFQAFCFNIKSKSAKPILHHNFEISGAHSKPSQLMRHLIKLILLVWGSGYKNRKRQTARPKNWDNKNLVATNKLMRFFIIKNYHWSSKPFEQGLLAIITAIFGCPFWYWENLWAFGSKILLANYLP